MTNDTANSYSAPALEKGLDILELLARHGHPMGTRQIADQLGRSKNEIFRMLHVLLSRGYLQRDQQTDALSLSDALFDLGMRATRARDLVAVAAPRLEQLAQNLRQAVHLVVAHRGETVIIAASSGGADLNFSLKLGYRRPLVDAHSGLVLLAHQSLDVQRSMLAEALPLSSEPKMRDLLDTQLGKVRREGAIIAASRDILGLTDLCAPVLDAEGRAFAYVTLVAVTRLSNPPDFPAMLEEVLATCAQIQIEMQQSAVLDIQTL
jgi:DNA-binding IclR family transcriptional regulator